MLRKTTPAVLLALALALPVLADNSIPQVLHLASASPDTAPVWVSAREALDDRGLPRRQYAAMVGDETVALDERGAPVPLDKAPSGSTPVVRNSFRRPLTRNEISAVQAHRATIDSLSCPPNDTLFGRDWETSLRGETIASRAAGAEEVVVLEVVASEQGFLQRMPYTLLDTRVEQTLRSAAGVADGDRLLIAYRFARFLVGDTLWCNIDPAFNLRPKPGDRLLLVRRPPPHRLRATGLSLIVPDSSEFILGRPDDSVVWPRELRALDPATPLETDSFTALVKRLRKPIDSNQAAGTRQ